MTFSIITLGCKVNQYESNMMKENMLHHNFSYVDNFTDADIIIINTCTVTNTADKKCLRTVKSIINKYKNKIIVVTGCSTQNNPEVYRNLNIDILLGNNSKSKIGELVLDYINSKEKKFVITKTRKLDFEDMFIQNYNHVRAFIKIEDGCDNFCSYCIIPFVRGSVRCKDFDVIIKEAKSLAKNSHKDIDLTGIHTGHYQNNGHDLCDVISALSEIESLERIRISSIEITELNDKFFDLLKNNSKLCNHLHIPLQAGSDNILKLMNRKYNLNYFENIIKRIRSIRPDIAITTDIIVGHPYETDDDFNNTLEFCKKIEFAKIHVFPFSKRDGTKSASMPNQVDERIKKQKIKSLIELSEKLEEDYYNKFKGKEVDVLIEEKDDNYSYGHTSNYLYVKLPEALEIGNIYKRIL